MSSYSYVCVLILLYSGSALWSSPHTFITVCVPMLLHMCPRVLILLHVCPHTTTYASSYYYVAAALRKQSRRLYLWLFFYHCVCPVDYTLLYLEARRTGYSCTRLNLSHGSTMTCPPIEALEASIGVSSLLL